MSKYLILNFEGAKLFRKFNKDKVNRKCKDFSLNPITGTYKSRDFLPAFVEPITVHQVSNMLHVLFNERPVPSLRQCLYPRVEKYFEMAQNSFLKISTPMIAKNNEDYYYEIIQVKKGAWNSWNPAPHVNWEVLRRYVDNNEKFNIIVSKLNEVLEIDSQSTSLINVRELVEKLTIDKRLNLYDTILNLKGITGLIDYFGSYKGNGSFNTPVNCSITRKCNKMAHLVNTGLETVINLSGQIIVPVTEDDIIRLRTISKGFATILDGGLVTIDSIKDGSVISNDGFIKVENISDEKTKPALCE